MKDGFKIVSNSQKMRTQIMTQFWIVITVSMFHVIFISNIGAWFIERVLIPDYGTVIPHPAPSCSKYDKLNHLTQQLFFSNLKKLNI